MGPSTCSSPRAQRVPTALRSGGAVPCSPRGAGKPAPPRRCLRPKRSRCRATASAMLDYAWSGSPGVDAVVTASVQLPDVHLAPPGPLRLIICDAQGARLWRISGAWRRAGRGAESPIHNRLPPLPCWRLLPPQGSVGRLGVVGARRAHADAWQGVDTRSGPSRRCAGESVWHRDRGAGGPRVWGGVTEPWPGAAAFVLDRGCGAAEFFRVGSG